MSEAKAKETGAPATAEKKQKKSASSMLSAPKKVKVNWTLERCLKTASRFSNENDWQAGAPSAYKSACAHGWLAQCTAKMKGSKSAKKSA